MTGKTWLKNRIADVDEVTGDDLWRELTAEELKQLSKLVTDDEE